MSPGGKIAVGIGAAVVVGIGALAYWGFGMYEDEVCDHLKENAKIVAKIGPVTSCVQRTSASLDIEDKDTFVFALGGSKGAGRAIVQSTTDDRGNEEFKGVVLVVGDERILVEGTAPPPK